MTVFSKGIERMLAAPSFLFRVERVPANLPPGSTYRLSDLDLASRLSFFLWSSIPDDDLLNVAIRGKLKDPKVLEQQVRRMLRDPRSRALVDGFANRWLELSKLPGVVPDNDLYKEFDENLRDAMAKETQIFIASQLQEDRSVTELLTADYTFVNERLAQHYGIPNIYGDRFRRVTFTDGVRGGLLGQASILAVTSYPESDFRHDPRPLDAGESVGLSAASSAAGRAGAQGCGNRRRAAGAARTHGAASQERGLRFLPSADGPAGFRAGEF